MKNSIYDENLFVISSYKFIVLSETYKRINKNKKYEKLKKENNKNNNNNKKKTNRLKDRTPQPPDSPPPARNTPSFHLPISPPLTFIPPHSFSHISHAL